VDTEDRLLLVREATGGPFVCFIKGGEGAAAAVCGWLPRLLGCGLHGAWGGQVFYFGILVQMGETFDIPGCLFRGLVLVIAMQMT